MNNVERVFPLRPARDFRWAVAPCRASQLDPGAEELRVLRLCDGVRDVDAIGRASGLDPGDLVDFLERAHDLGAVVALPAMRVRRRTPERLVAWVRGTGRRLESEEA
jgi:hypothetical protein